MKIKWDGKEQLWWIGKNEMFTKFVEVLVKVFKETLRPDKKRIFNLTLLIRQNFLTLCETPEFITFLFGSYYTLWWWDEKSECYRLPAKLEDEVIEKVMKELDLEEAKLNEIY